jgi:hypothetical protein
MCVHAQVGASRVQWQESQDVDTWLADAAVRDLSEWRAEYAVTLRNRVHYLRGAMRAAGELLFDGAVQRPPDNRQQH